MFITDPPFSAEIKNEWSLTTSSPIFLHGVDSDDLPLPMTFDSVCYLKTMCYLQQLFGLRSYEKIAFVGFEGIVAALAVDYCKLLCL